MRLLILTLSMFLTTLTLMGQKQADNWYFGRYAGIEFSSGEPNSILDGQLFTAEGCATLSDSLGNLLLYTDGITVWNGDHFIVDNGTDLLGNPSSTHSGIIVPHPCNQDQYYVFTSAIGTSNEGINYSIVDLTENSGTGKVIEKNTNLIPAATEKLTAVGHCNGTDYWIIAHGWNNNRFHAFQLTCNGIENEVISNIGSTHPIISGQSIGQMKISPNGRYLAVATRTTNGIAELFKFNNATGAISDLIALPTIGSEYGVEFSADNKKLYYASHLGNIQKIFQYDLTNDNASNIIASRILINPDDTLGFVYGIQGGLQLANNGKIYSSYSSRPYLSSIENPTQEGVASNYQHESVDLLGRNAAWGLPTLVQSFLFDPASSNFSLDKTCEGDSTQFYAATSSSYASWNWNFDDPASGNNTSSIENPKHLFSDTGTFTVILIAETYCQIDTIVQEIYITEKPTANAGNDTSICFGDSLQLGIGSTNINFTYLWTPSSGLSDNSTLQPFAKPSQSQSYILSINSGNQCFDYDTINLGIGPVIDAGADIWMCAGDTATLGGSPTGDHNASFLWTPADSLSDDTIANPLAFPDTSTVYTLTVTDSIGCSRQDTIEVIIGTKKGDNGFTHLGACEEIQQFTDTSHTPFTNWSWDLGFSNMSILQNPSHAYLFETGTIPITLIAWDSLNACVRDTMHDTLTLFSLQVDLGGDRAICQGDSVTLGSDPTASGSSDITYEWTPASILDDPSSSNPKASPSSSLYCYLNTYPTQYPACSVYVRHVISVSPQINVDAGDDTTICLGESVTIGPSLVDTSIQYQWSPNTYLDNDDIPNPTTTPDASITYFVDVSRGLCSSSDSININVLPIPEVSALVDNEKSVTILADESIEITGSISNADSFAWTPSSWLSDNSILNPIATPEDDITYFLTGFNGACTAVDSVYISIIKEILVTLPSSFTPNQDGQNDLLTLITEGIDHLNYFNIYDRWGNMLFSSNSLTQGWDGTNVNIESQNIGTYYYEYEVVGLDNNLYQKSGSIVLIK